MAVKSHVDANYRFIAAYQEINVRIAQRQQALTLYVMLTVSLLAAIVALKPSAGSNTLPIEWLVLGFSVASICLVFLNVMAERAIANLRRFLYELEKLDSANESLPSYHADPEWTLVANKARRFHLFAAAVLVAGGNAIGMGATIAIYPERIAAYPVIIWVNLSVALISIIALLIIPRWSFRTT
ncbi:hypothetical protein [Methylotenera versatilis]|uniref:hypothetical protein n=1 Tax=Methylotenera versatilis TaxID=1055487 RepID=UPI00064558F5|nr:hypothetical protein [Methylotenera versatilis]